MWKYYTLFIRVRDEIIVISACISVFLYTLIRIVIYEFTFNMMRISMKRVSVEIVKYIH